MKISASRHKTSIYLHLMQALKKNLPLIFFSIFFFCVFALFTLVVKTKSLDMFDFNMTVKVQNHIPKKFDMYLSLFSLVGSFEVTSIALLIILLSRKKLQAFIPFVLFAGSHLLELIGKAFMHHPGPPFLFFRYTIPFLFPSSYVQPGSSYPSGHSFRIVFLSVIVSYLVMKARTFTKNGKFICLTGIVLFDIIMLVTRVSLGEHWSTDVVGGTLLGLSSGFLSLLFL